MSFDPFNNPHNITAEQSAHMAANQYAQQQQQLLSAFKVQSGRDGKARLMGFEVPAELASTLNIVLAGVMLPVSKGVSDFIYRQTKSIAETELVAKNLPALHKNAPKAALYAELATMWGILAARPIMEFVGANQHYTAERWKIGREIKSVCEATGADPSHNEVFKAAFHRVHQNWTDEIKLVLPSMISVVPYSMGALKMHNETVLKRQPAIEISEKLAKGQTTHTGKTLTADQVRQNLAIEKGNAIEALRHEEYKKFKSKYGNRYDDKELKEHFKEHWGNIRDNLDTTKEDLAHQKSKTGGIFGDNTQDMFNFSMFAGATQTLGEALSSSMRKRYEEKAKHHTSYELIMQLKEQMQGRQNPQSVHEAVVNIFQQLEEDMGRTKFAGGLLEKLSESVQPISEAIAKGSMDALSLIKLAGEHKIIAHSNSGKRSFRNEDEIKKAVDEARSMQVIKENEISEEAFMAKFADPVLAKETIKKNIAEMKEGPVRDLFIALMPSEIIEHAGVRKETIRDSRRRSFEKLPEYVGAGILHIAASDHELLKKHGLSSKEIAGIKSLSESIMAGDREALQSAVDDKDATITSIIATEMLAAQMDGKTKIWTERVAEAKGGLDNLVQKIIAEKETKGEEDMPLAARETHDASHVQRRDRKQLEAKERNLDLGA